MMTSQECRLTMEAILRDAPRDFRRWLRIRYRESDGLFDWMGPGEPEKYSLWEMEILHRLTSLANETEMGESWVGSKDTLTKGWPWLELRNRTLESLFGPGESLDCHAQIADEFR